MDITIERYVLGCQAHLPGKTDCFKEGDAIALPYELPEDIQTDKEAIEVAAQYFGEFKERFDPGWQVGATLWQGKRRVINFDDMF